MKARGPDHEHGDEEADHRHRGVITARIASPEMTPEALGELDRVEELPEELQAGVRRQSILGEAEGQFGLDGSGQIAFSMSHRWCPFGSGKDRSRFLFLYDRKAHWAREKAASFTGDRLFLHPVMTDQG
jgi:hypothetical protein